MTKLTDTNRPKSDNGYSCTDNSDKFPECVFKRPMPPLSKNEDSRVVLLGTALLKVLQCVGMLNKEATPTGPELLLFADEYCEAMYKIAAAEKAGINRTLDQITQAVRRNEPVSTEELRYTVVAYDVLLAQLNLSNYPELLHHYFEASESAPKDYAGPNNDPENPEAIRWYETFIPKKE